MNKYNDIDSDSELKYKKFDIFDLHPYSEGVENMKRAFIYELLSLSHKLGKLKCCQTIDYEPIKVNEKPDIIDAYLESRQAQVSREESVNIKGIIDNFNDVMITLSNIFNSYVDLINSLNSIYIPTEIGLGSLPKFDLKYITYQPLIFESYDVPVSQGLIDFLNGLKNNTIDLYRKITSIPNIIPKLESIEQIENEIEQELIRKHLI